MPDISIVIVNYNVSAFLQQCLYSVQKSSVQDIDVEVFVVDNNSIDNSVELVKENFPDVKLIANTDNKGFAYACNQAIRQSTGKYVLLLNPDTIIREDSLKLCKQFMDNNKDVGALGVKMINGKGKFLPESKRSLPNAKSSFYKIFGLSALFPKSKKFGQYQLKYLDKDEIHSIEVLSGAYMFIRKSVLDEIGLLDENFFMYGEDIDLSYRIIKAGYKNIYFPKTTIIHYKGKSTKKASIKYVKVFYNAMLIFANKHYTGKKQLIFRLFINLAIYFRAFLALLQRLFQAIYLPVLDFSAIYLIYRMLIPVWENYKFAATEVYSDVFTNIFIPVYIIIWQISIVYQTKYRLNAKLRDLIKAILTGTLVILLLYSLLPESYRYSRVLIIFGMFFSLTATIINRTLIRLLIYGDKHIFSSAAQKALIITDKEQTKSANNHHKQLSKHYIICNSIIFSKTDKYTNQLHENIKLHKIETIIFLMNNLSYSDIIDTITNISDKNLEFKIMLNENASLIGEQSVVDIGKIPYLKLNPISRPINKFKKRVLDYLISFMFFILYPILLITNNERNLFNSIWQVISGKKTWVSYAKEVNITDNQLPKLKTGIFEVCNTNNNENYTVLEINKIYAQNYSAIKDIIIIFKSLKKTNSNTK